MIDTVALRFATPMDSALNRLESFEKSTFSDTSQGILEYASQTLTTAIEKVSTMVFFYFNSNKILNEMIENPTETKEIILNHNITKQEDLKTLASSLLEKAPPTLASCIHDFGIKDQEFLDDINLSLNPTKRIDMLIKNRLSNLNLELNRLKSVPRIQQSLDKISTKLSLTLEHTVAIAQSIELRECLKSKYYVINHGQNNSGIIANIVAKKVSELFESKKQEYFEVLRHDTFLKNLPKDRDVTWYKTKLKKDLTLTDHNFREELICGDIDLERTDPYESAIHFSTGSDNIAVSWNPDFIKQIIQKIVKNYFSDEALSKKISEETDSIGEHLTGGTLYSICIPKDKFDSIAYLSKPFGRPLDNLSYTTEDRLNSWQEGTCAVDTQVRLLTNKLTTDNGIFIIPHSTLSKEQLSKIESAVENSLLNAKKTLIA